MTYLQWYEIKLKEKLATIDLYLDYGFRNGDSTTLLWHEPVIPDDEAIDYDHPCADRHFQSRILTHIWRKWSHMRVETFADSIRVSPRESTPK